MTTGTSTGDRPNIVLVTCDSLRADHCGFMGYDRDTTPALDRLARDGLVFTDAIASGVPTIASMTSVMTGEHSLASPEVGFDTVQREQVTARRTLAEVLSAAGYATGGLSPNPPASSYFGFDAGFDWFEDFLHEDRGVVERLWNRVFRRSIRGGTITTPLRLARNVVGREEVLRPWEDYYDRLLDWRDGVEEPYFLWVLLLDPHHPWFPPASARRWSSRADALRSFHQYWTMLDSGWEPAFSPREHRRLLDLYDDSIRYTDRFIERLYRDLTDRGDDPVFVVHADHGEAFGEHGRYGHQAHLTEALVHVPLVVSGGGVATRREPRPVGLRSLAPTIADLAGTTHPSTARSLFAGPRSPWVTSKVFAEGRRRVALRTETATYLAEGDQRALYNRRAAPTDRENLVDDRPAVASAFETALRRHVETERDLRALREASERLTGTADGRPTGTERRP